MISGDGAEVIHLKALLTRRDELLRAAMNYSLPYPLTQEILQTIAPPRTLPSIPFWVGSRQTRAAWEEFMETKPTSDQIHAATKLSLSEREDALKFVALSDRLG